MKTRVRQPVKKRIKNDSLKLIAAYYHSKSIWAVIYILHTTQNKGLSCTTIYGDNYDTGPIMIELINIPPHKHLYINY